jgi:L-threonylcarbamoyladenylate synthase
MDTVGIRIPSNAIAISILEAAGVPLAAPSANPFMGLSATRVEHLDPSLLEKVDVVIDGGPCDVGLESTVIDVTSDPPRILRPGGVSRGDVQAALRRPLGSTPPKGPRRSPGMYRRHYAPRSALRIVEKLEPPACGLGFDIEPSERRIRMPRDPADYARELYAALARLDALHPRVIQVEAPPDEPEWEAVWDRLRRASSRN